MTYSEDNQPVNLARLRDSFADDIEFIVEMYGMFVDDARNRLATLDRVLLERDFPGIRDVAHALKGSSANIGAEELSRIAAQLELAEIENDPGTGDEFARALRTEFEAVAQFVQEYTHSLH